MTVTIIVGVISALGAGLLTQLVKRPIEKQSADNESIAAAAERDKSETARFSAIIEGYSRQVADMAATYGALDERLRRVEDELDAETRRSNAAVSYIRQLLRWIGDRLPGEVPPPVPDALRSDV